MEAMSSCRVCCAAIHPGVVCLSSAALAALAAWWWWQRVSHNDSANPEGDWKGPSPAVLRPAIPAAEVARAGGVIAAEKCLEDAEVWAGAAVKTADDAGASRKASSSPFSDEATLAFVRRLRSACEKLPAPGAEIAGALPGSEKTLARILNSRSHTYQRKTTNVQQIHSLAAIVVHLVGRFQRAGLSVCVLDLGAGKALLARAVYELFERRVRVVASCFCTALLHPTRLITPMPFNPLSCPP